MFDTINYLPFIPHLIIKQFKQFTSHFSHNYN